MNSPLVQLLDDCWPSVTFPERCWVTLAKEDDQGDFADVIDIVSSLGGRDALIQRLRDEHPTKKEHHQQYDTRLLDAMTEAMAFAWAAETGLGHPRFCMREGFPDLEVGDEWWVEVKAVHFSDAERRAVREGIEQGGGALVRVGWKMREAPAALIGKLESSWGNALQKFERVDPGRRRRGIVWMRLEGFDWPVARRPALEDVAAWGEETASAANRGIVVVEAWDWRAPLLSCP